MFTLIVNGKECRFCSGVLFAVCGERTCFVNFEEWAEKFSLDDMLNLVDYHNQGDKPVVVLWYNGTSHEKYIYKSVGCGKGWVDCYSSDLEDCGELI